jgi:hypothetical protein
MKTIAMLLLLLSAGTVFAQEDPAAIVAPMRRMRRLNEFHRHKLPMINMHQHASTRGVSCQCQGFRN